MNYLRDDIKAQYAIPTDVIVVGLTKVGEVVGYKKEGDKFIAVPGRLLYRGIDIEDIVDGFQKDHRHGFEETVFLLLTGKLPKRQSSRSSRPISLPCGPCPTILPRT